jgi:hypothetical protein
MNAQKPAISEYRDGKLSAGNRYICSTKCSSYKLAVFFADYLPVDRVCVYAQRAIQWCTKFIEVYIDRSFDNEYNQIDIKAQSAYLWAKYRRVKKA